MTQKPTYKELEERIKELGKELAERNKREKALKESSTKFKGIAERNFDGILTLDLSGTITYLSPAAERITGFTLDDTEGNRFQKFLPKNEQPKLTKAFAHIMQGHSGDGMILQTSNKDGLTIYLECNAVPIIRNNEIAGAQIVFRDITERKRIEEQLRKNEYTYRLLAESQKDVFFTLSADGTVTYCSPAIKQFGGYNAPDVLGTHFNNYLTVETEPRWIEQMFDKLVMKKQSPSWEFLYSPKDRAPFPVEVTSIATVSENQEITLQCIMRDITEKKRLEKEIVEISEREKRQVGQDLHDGLGQLLTGISFMSKRLESDLADKSLKETAAAARITQLIGDSISQTRDIAKGLYPVNLDEGNLIEAFKQLANERSEMFNISCHFRANKNIVILNKSKTIHLYRIAQEAISNAFRHGKADRIELYLKEHKGNISLTIKDNGVGIEEPNDKHTGIGLKTMDYRARIIGAVFDIHRAEDGGTIMRCSFENRTRETA